MVSTFTLLVPEADQTEEVIEAYYQRYLDKTRDLVDADSVSDLIEYRQTRESLEEEGRFLIYQELRTSVAERLETPPHTIITEYGDDGELWNERGLAALDRLFQEARRKFEAEDDYTFHHDLYGYETLVEFAIENGYGISYP